MSHFYSPHLGLCTILFYSDYNLHYPVHYVCAPLEFEFGSGQCSYALVICLRFFSLFKGKWDFTGQQSLWCSPSSLAFSFLAVSVPALESYASLSFINHLFIFVLPLCWTSKISPPESLPASSIWCLWFFIYNLWHNVFSCYNYCLWPLRQGIFHYHIFPLQYQ